MTVRNADFFFSPDNSFFEKDNFNVYNNKTCKRIEFRLLSVQASGSSASSPCTRRTMASPCGAGGAGGRTGHFPCGRASAGPAGSAGGRGGDPEPPGWSLPGFFPRQPPSPLLARQRSPPAQAFALYERDLTAKPRPAAPAAGLGGQDGPGGWWLLTGSAARAGTGGGWYRGCSVPGVPAPGLFAALRTLRVPGKLCSRAGGFL